MFFRYLPRNLVAGAAALTIGAGIACADESSAFAERGGFLLGHAYRCGVAAESLERPARLVHDLIAAASTDEDQKNAADEVFSVRFLASWLAAALGDQVPSCTLVRRDLARLMRHPRPVPTSGEPAMSRKTGSPKAELPGRAVKPARAKKSGSTRREELSSNRRAEIAERLTARQERGRPPSI